jgi:hypothetical protein
MFDTLMEIWSNKGFEILFILSIVVILILALFRIGKKGSWSKTYYYSGDKVSKGATPSDKTRKSTAPTSSGELECRRVLQKIFNKPFDKERPNFLNNPVTGGAYNLELDCFCGELKLAVEYNGRQHYEYVPFFHKNKEDFLNGKYRDELKRRMCRDNGITLIEVPYTIRVNDIEAYLTKQLYSK